MKKIIILLLAVVTSALAILEAQTIGFPHPEQFVFSVLSLYVPASIVIITTAALVFLRFSWKKVCWSLVSGTVVTMSSYVLSPLTIYVGECIDVQSASDLDVFLIFSMMAGYLMAVPAIVLGIYFYSINDTIEKIKQS